MIILLLLLLVCLSIILLVVKNNLHLVMFFSVFSFTAAAVYFFSQAPDIALAEVAVGSAFIPLVYLIAIGKQKKFNVLLDFVGAKGQIIEPESIRSFTEVLEQFCLDYSLELNLVHYEGEEGPNVQRIFRVGNVDLICHYHLAEDSIEMKGNASNIMLNSLEQRLQEDGRIVWKRVKDHETAI